MDELTSFETDILTGKICPYCKCETKIVTDKEIYGHKSNYNKYFIQCIQNSEHYVGTFSNGKSLGRLANAELRKLKRNGHEVFDKLWQGEQATFKSRDQAYQWLSKKMKLSKDLTHFAMFSDEQCIQSINVVNRMMKLPLWLRQIIN
jgi:hypothetical protein